MKWSPFLIKLSHEYSRPFAIFWIIFDNLGIEDTGHYLAHQNRISSQFIIPVSRDTNLVILN